MVCRSCAVRTSLQTDTPAALPACRGAAVLWVSPPGSAALLLAFGDEDPSALRRTDPRFSTELREKVINPLSSFGVRCEIFFFFFLDSRTPSRSRLGGFQL